MLERFSLRRTSRENQPLRFLQVEDIHINPNQPRKFFDEKALEELTASIRQYGLINPLTVRETGEGYELIAGERRLRASRGAGLHTVPCYVLPSSDQDSSVLALAENLQRQDLDFYEEAQGIARLIHVHGLTQQQAASAPPAAGGHRSSPSIPVQRASCPGSSPAGKWGAAAAGGPGRRPP